MIETNVRFERRRHVSTLWRARARRPAMDESTPLIGRRREGRRGARGALVVGALACACGTLVAFANCPHLVSQFSRAIGVGDADGAGARGVNAVFARLGAVWGRDDSDYVYTSLERDLLRPHEDDDEIEDEIDEIDADAKDGKVAEQTSTDRLHGRGNEGLAKVATLGEPALPTDLPPSRALATLDEIEAVLLGNWRKWTRLDVVRGRAELETVRDKLAALVGDDVNETTVADSAAEVTSTNETSFISCEAEQLVREILNEYGGAPKLLLPKLLRFIFHDAVDENNLLIQKGGRYVPFRAPTGSIYGGLDLCLYSPLTQGTSGKPDPGHNRNVRMNREVIKLCNAVCKDLNTGLCELQNDKPKRCYTDMLAFSSIIVLEKHSKLSAPSSMVWGRRGGECGNSIVTPFTKSREKLESYVGKPALNFAPALHAMDDPGTFSRVFAKLGFTPSEHVALMGAHSVGKISPCASGLNGIEKGNFCPMKKRYDPPIEMGNESPQCQPQKHVQGNCWKPSGPKSYATPYYYFFRGGRTGYKTGFADGGVWDHTPDSLDNEYYKLMYDEDYGGRTKCCGGKNQHGCHRRGKPVDRETGRKLPFSSLCNINWCRSDRKGRTHMKSTKAWVEPRHSLLKLPYFRGTIVKMIRLAGDWALLGNNETQSILKRYAEDENEFHSNFAVAWDKVLRKGYFLDELKTCSNVSGPKDAQLLTRLREYQAALSAKRAKRVAKNARRAGVEAKSSDQTSNLGQQSSVQEDATTDKTLQAATATMDNAKYDDGLDTATHALDLEQVVPKSISTTIQHCDKFNVLGLVKHIRSEIQKLPRDTTPLAIGQELTAARDVVMGQNVQMSEPTPAPAPAPAPTPSPAPSPGVEQSDESSNEDGGDAKIYSLEHAGARCVGLPRAKRVRRTRSVEECAELVKKRGHLHFAFLRNAVCLEQPKPWSKCRRIRKGRFDLYKIKAEPAPPAPPPAPPAPPAPSTWSSTWSSTPSTYSYSAATCKRKRGKFFDGKCWHMATTDTSCEETCADKNLQYDEGTHLGSPKNPETWDKCVAVAQMFKKRARTNGPAIGGGGGCGCSVFKIPAYGTNDAVRLSGANTTSPECWRMGPIQARLCACKPAAAVGASCTSSSSCLNGYCKSGVCTSFLAQNSACTEHAPCVTGYCSPTERKCTTVSWKSQKGAYAKKYYNAGKKKFRVMPKQKNVPDWEAMTTFPKGFCIGNDGAGCLIARGVNRQKTIQKAKQRCATSEECAAVWCCATGCPATTCHAVKTRTPNYVANDCPLFPGSFRETKYPATFYTKDTEGAQVREPPRNVVTEADIAASADQGENMYSRIKGGKRRKVDAKQCPLQKLKARTLDECAEMVREHGSLHFAFGRKTCMLAKQPWSECETSRGRFDLFQIDGHARDDSED